MINFSTEFPIDSKNSIEDVVRLARDWVLGSPHTKFKKSDLERIPVDEEETFAAEFQKVTIGTSTGHDSQMGGLQYVNQEEGLEWTSSIVSSRTEASHLLSIQVSCEALSTAVTLPAPKKPYFVRQVLHKLGGGMDGHVPVADRPFRLDSGEAPIAAALMLGTARNRLPIIYVSAGFDDKYLIDPDEMATWMGAMAHVVVEPDRRFSLELKRLTKSHNVFGGTVGVYWPESSARKSYFLDVESPNKRSLQIEIARDVRLALCNRRPSANCTWPSLKETIARKKYESLKARGSTELQDYISVFDADQAAKDAKLLEADREIARLNAELRRYAAAAAPSSRGLLSLGEEQDLYQNETRDFVIDALREGLRVAKEGGRREDVLNSLLIANVSSGEGQRIGEEIKSILRTYREMDARTRSALLRLGFDISDDGKHYKAVFQGDGRYTFVLPTTSSDHRAGKNLASDIVSTLF